LAYHDLLNQAGGRQSGYGIESNGWHRGNG
jgi:hypothetical protein